jgi:hypothetical protein
MFKLLEMAYIILVALIYLCCVITLGIFIGMLQIFGLNKDTR